jgi:hypothetical protein
VQTGPAVKEIISTTLSMPWWCRIKMTHTFTWSRTLCMTVLTQKSLEPILKKGHQGKN